MLEELAGEPALLADTGTGVHVPVRSPRAPETPHVLHAKKLPGATDPCAVPKSVPSGVPESAPTQASATPVRASRSGGEIEGSTWDKMRGRSGRSGLVVGEFDSFAEDAARRLIDAKGTGVVKGMD